MNKIITWSVTVAVAGFLFGFDTAVISGADQAIQKLWDTSPLVHGLFVMSSALWGTVLGALTGNIPCDKLGRKKTLVIIGVLYLLSAIGSALAQDPYTFAILRFIGGIGVGISSIVVPAYISEIAPAHLRGRLVATYQFQIVFGILIAFLSNYLLTDIIPQDWRAMLGVEAVPALVYLILVLKAPESPRWLLLKRNNESEAREVMQELGSEDIDITIAQVRESALRQPTTSLFKSEYKLPITLAFLIAAFNQLSGINFIIYYAPRVFEMAGLNASNALLSTAGVGLVNLVFTMVGMCLIDKCGRKLLMYVGSLGYILSLATVTWAFYSEIGGTVVVFAIFVFIASHALGQGAVIWVFIAEIFPNSVRSKGQSLGSGTHWIFAAIITLIMPQVLVMFSAYHVFFFFTFAMFLQLIFVRFMMPETKGRTLEDVASELSE